MRITAIALVLGLTTFGSAELSAQIGQADSTKKKEEAISLFQQAIVEIEREQPWIHEQCRFMTEWSPYLIGQETTDGELVGAESPATIADIPASPREILDPDNQDATAFCDSDQLNRHGEEQAAELARQPENQSRAGVRAEISQVEFSFPVFNRDYTKAMFGFTVLRSFYAVDPRRRLAPDGFIAQAEASKELGKWKLTHTQVVGIIN